MTAKPITMKDAVVSVAGTDYGAEASSVVITPNVNVTTWAGLKPTAVVRGIGTVEWNVNMSVGMDFNDATSLGRYLFEHQGEEVPLEFRPMSDGAGVSANVIVVPGSIGGNVNAVSESSVSLPVQGSPTFLAAPA